MKKAFLDGALVPIEEINPEMHRYIGVQRPIEISQVCPQCGLLPHSITIIQEHKEMGHYDIPKYETIIKMSESRVKIGDIVTYSYGLFPNTPYRYIGDMPNGIAIVEDKNKHRWQFSKRALCPANDLQILDFNSTCKDCEEGNPHYHDPG